MLEDIKVPIYEAQPHTCFEGLLGHFGFKPERPSLRHFMCQWHRDTGKPLEHYVDVYAEDNWVELYTRPRKGKHLSQRFNGKVETALDLARLMYQCEYITPDEWEAAQRIYGPPMRWREAPQFPATAVIENPTPELIAFVKKQPKEEPPF